MYLAGGDVRESNPMEIKSFYERESGTWTHVLADTSEGVAAIIDPVWVYDPVSGIADSAFVDRILDAATPSDVSASTCVHVPDSRS